MRSNHDSVLGLGKHRSKMRQVEQKCWTKQRQNEVVLGKVVPDMNEFGTEAP